MRAEDAAVSVAPLAVSWLTLHVEERIRQRERERGGGEGGREGGREKNTGES